MAIKRESEFGSPVAEAKSVALLVRRNKESVESALSLIRATPRQREVLFMLFPLPAHTSLEKMFAYRRQVEKEFLRLVKKGRP
jgi:hypothetical protein